MLMMNGCTKKYQQGLSLIELMISLVIGLLLTAAVLQTFISSRITYSVQTELAKLQENARFAMTYLQKDFRAAGYIGCKPYSHYESNVASVLSSDLDGVSSDWFTPYIMTDKTFPTSDSIRVRYTQSASSCEVSGVTAESTAESGEYYFECKAPHIFQQGNTLVAVDCKHLAVFNMTNENPNFDQTVIKHAATNGNCVSGLGKNSACGTSSFSEAYVDWKDGAVVQRLSSHHYTVETNSFGQTALMRDGDDLIEGVENMQIELGIDTDDDQSANCFATDPSDCGGTSGDVVAVRISLLMVSLEDNIIDARPSNEFSGTAFAGYSPSDRKLRKVVVSTITLRNGLIKAYE